MKKEEAIKRFQRMKKVLSIPNSDAERTIEAIDMAIEALSAEPTVIRSKTLMPTKDFKEWAKRVREEDPNAIIIPCDAEVVSAELTLQTPQTYGKSVNPSNAEVVADLISRADAIEAVRNICNTPCNEYFVNALKALPSADRPSGEWMCKDSADMSVYWFECSECGEKTPRDNFNHEYKSNYCPNCGAKMGGNK